jgi:hypothetical protein
MPGRGVDVNSLYYFSYGSNMSTRRLTARVPSAKKICNAYLPGHLLRFHKRGRDDSAKCDAHFTDNDNDQVKGVLFEILAAEKPLMDAIEGLDYESKKVSVLTDDEKTMVAFTYVAVYIDKSLKPYHWYKQHILVGAHEHQLPDDYISSIETIESIEDKDAARIERELGIYR